MIRTKISVVLTVKIGKLVNLFELYLPEEDENIIESSSNQLIYET